MESRPAQAVDRASASGRLNNVWTRLRTSPRWIVAIALLLRVTWIVIGHTYKFKSSDDSFGFGWEMGRIGASLAAGHGFSSPFGPSTGPTAWEPPLYPYLTAGVFLVFGIYSKASACVLLTMNSVFSALTCVPIFRIARRIFSERVAVGSAWAWVLVPPSGLGDEPGGAAADYDLLAGSDSGRPRRLDALASVRIALGHHRIEQYVIAVISAGCGIVGLVPPREKRQAIVSRRGARLFSFPGMHHALAGPQL